MSLHTLNDFRPSATDTVLPFDNKEGVYAILEDGRKIMFKDRTSPYGGYANNRYRTFTVEGIEIAEYGIDSGNDSLVPTMEGVVKSATPWKYPYTTID